MATRNSTTTTAISSKPRRTGSVVTGTRTTTRAAASSRAVTKIELEGFAVLEHVAWIDDEIEQLKQIDIAQKIKEEE